MTPEIQAIYDKIDTYLRSKATLTPNPAKVWANDEAELLEDILVELQKAGGVDPSNFAPYHPDKEYSVANPPEKLEPDYVSYDDGTLTNVYQYIYPTPATGIIPTNTSYWKNVSAGQFNHIQNTDLGTSNNRFSIQRNSQNQDIDGITILDFGTQQGGKVTAIGLHWYNDGSGDESYELKICYDYTGTGSDIWEDMVLTAIQKQKIQNLPTLNSPDIEILTAPKLYKSGSLLAATAGSVKYQGTTYAVPAVANISGGIAGFNNKQFFAVAAYNTGTDEFQTTALFATAIGGTMPEKLPIDNQAYLGLYKYEGGVLSELPFNYATSAVFTDGTTAVADAKGVMNLTKLTVFKPILAFELGDHPTVDLMSQDEVNAYLFALASGGTYTPPTGTISSASATPLSDTEIEIDWTITP